MDNEGIANALLRARTETEATAAVEAVPEMAIEGNWRLLDDSESNWSTAGNQQSDSAKALTELMTNMVDALLLKRCYEEGIGPRSTDAPINMHSAAAKFFPEIVPGQERLALRQRTESHFARENLVVGVTGHKKSSVGYPTFTFIDNGEGQHPADFSRTFLSFKQTNKSGIRFVQGRFNMGSSGVLSYSGRRFYKFILSRRHTKDGAWGWTLIRERPRREGSRNPTYEYFAPGGAVCTFVADRLEPLTDQDGNAYPEIGVSSGTVVKVFDYKVPNKYAQQSEMRQMFFENVIDTLLPFRLFDLRVAKTKSRPEGVDERALYGMAHKIAWGDERAAAEMDDDRGVLVGEEFVEIEGVGTVRISPFFFAKGVLDSNIGCEEYGPRVFHHVNGQVHYKEKRGLLTQLGFSRLKDHVVILIDASDLSDNGRDRIWKGDRENVKQSIEGDLYLKKVSDSIRVNVGLKSKQEELARADHTRASRIDTTNLFSSMVKSDKRLSALLSGFGMGIQRPMQTTVEREEVRERDAVPAPAFLPYEGNDVPTFLKLADREEEQPYECPQKRGVRLWFETDARDDFLTSAKPSGLLWIEGLDAGRFTKGYGMKGGLAWVRLTPVEGTEVGTQARIKVVIYSSAMARPVSSEVFAISVIEPPTKEKKSKHKTDEQEERKAESGLPTPTLATRDGRDLGEMGPSVPWSEHGFDESDGGRIVENGDERNHVINFDNRWHLEYLAELNAEARDLLSKKFVIGMQVSFSTLSNAWDAKRAKAEEVGMGGDDPGSLENGEYADLEGFSRMMSKGSAAAFFPVCLTLSKAGLEQKKKNDPDEPDEGA